MSGTKSASPVEKSRSRARQRTERTAKSRSPGYDLPQSSGHVKPAKRKDGAARKSASTQSLLADKDDSHVQVPLANNCSVRAVCLC
jgi:hypothetical protein